MFDLNTILTSTTVVLDFAPIKQVVTVAIGGSVALGLIGFGISLIARAFRG